MHIRNKHNNKQMATPKQKTSIYPSDVLAAYAKHGKDMFIINREKSSSNKDKSVHYYQNLIRMEDGSEREPFLYLPLIEIFGCKSPEKRAVINRDLAPGFSFKRSVVGPKGEPVGEAAYILGTCWEDKVNEMISEKKLNKGMCHGFIQSTTKDGKEFDDPIIRIKLRSVNKQDKRIAKEILVMQPDGTMRNTTRSGQPFTSDNVHEDFKSGSHLAGVINFAQTTHSTQGYSNQDSHEVIKLVPGNGRNLNADVEIDNDDVIAMRNILRANNSNVAQENDEDNDGEGQSTTVESNPGVISMEQLRSYV